MPLKRIMNLLNYITPESCTWSITLPLWFNPVKVNKSAIWLFLRRQCQRHLDPRQDNWLTTTICFHDEVKDPRSRITVYCSQQGRFPWHLPIIRMEGRNCRKSAPSKHLSRREPTRLIHFLFTNQPLDHPGNGSLPTCLQIDAPNGPVAKQFNSFINHHIMKW